jgi:hypothetical protein
MTPTNNPFLLTKSLLFRHKRLVQRVVSPQRLLRALRKKSIIMLFASAVSAYSAVNILSTAHIYV